MYIMDYLRKFENKRIKLFVDMDGVIAHYDFGKPFGYMDKRPLTTSIEKLKEISNYDNIEMYILSVSKTDLGLEEKNIWLDKDAPFFKKENRVILSKETYPNVSTMELKSNYLKEINRDNSIIILIDDDPRILKEVNKNNEDIYLLKDSALID